MCVCLSVYVCGHANHLTHLTQPQNICEQGKSAKKSGKGRSKKGKASKKKKKTKTSTEEGTPTKEEVEAKEKQKKELQEATKALNS